MSSGTIKYREHKTRGADYRDTKDMLPVSTAKKVWISIGAILKFRGITVEKAAEEIGIKYTTLKNIRGGYLSSASMRLIKKWAEKI